MIEESQDRQKSDEPSSLLHSLLVPPPIKKLGGLVRAGLKKVVRRNFYTCAYMFFDDEEIDPRYASGHYNPGREGKWWNKLIRLVHGYDRRFDIDDVGFLGGKVPNDEAIQFDPRFSGKDIDTMHLSDVTPDVASSYDARFNGNDISFLVKADVLPVLARGYDDFNGFEIGILFNLGLSNNDIPESKRESYTQLLRDISNKSRVRDNPEDFNLLGTGVSGVVLRHEDTAWKFSTDIEHEFDILHRISQYHGNSQSHMLRVFGEIEGELGVQIEYIEGRTLEERMSQPFTRNEILRYSSQIMQGLVEMRQAGVVYHRDLRPANIMIDEENDRAVIIDLGIATTDRSAPVRDNRRYGSSGSQPNDLISLGQIMYAMTTGDRLFATSTSMDETMYAERIRDERDEAYSQPGGMRSYLDRVYETVQDPLIRNLITSCLTSRRGQYKIMQREFEAHREAA